MKCKIPIINYKGKKIFTLTVSKDQRGFFNHVHKLNNRKCRNLAFHSRNVFRCGDYVIKIDNSYNQNHDEWCGYAKIKKEDRKYFAQVVGRSRDYCFVVQKFVGNRLKAFKEEHYNKVWKLKKKYNIGDMDTGYNVRYQAHGPVIFDLGFMGYGYTNESGSDLS